MPESQNDKKKEIIKDFVSESTEAQLPSKGSDIDEFAAEHPGLQRQNKESIQDMQPTDVLSDSLVQANEGDSRNETTENDLVGRKIGNFEIVEIIGRGGMGIVYLARDTKLNRSVAIKSLPDKLIVGSTAQKRLRREAKLLASLNHPNIAVIHDIIEQEEGPDYLVLEYVPGDTLAQRIVRKRLKYQEALSIGQQIAEAISVAHDKGVIHRDLKPGNIKITPEGKVKVLDFGLAKPAGDEVADHDSMITRPGAIMGTPAYMSPEQARGKDTDHRTDIWSFGCIMYEMLSGHLPFEGETSTDMLARVIEREPDWDVLPQSTPMNINVLLRRCLEKDPQQRLGDITNAALEIKETLITSAPTVRTKSRKLAMIMSVIIIVILSAIALRYILEKQTLPSSEEIRMVVLPFENLGPTEDDYFTDGVTEEITSRLSAIHSLGVISRTSATQYRKRDKTIRQIGEELSVEYVLEGTVRWVRPPEGPSQIRVTPQLIRVSDDTHLWSDRYDAVLSNIFQVQSDIAEKVAKALDIALLEPERQVIGSRPTKNMDAYEYYLRGNEYYHRSSLEKDLTMAAQMYEKAIDLDPAFALAYARLSEIHANMYWYHHDHSEERIALAKQAIDKAFQLNPELPEVRLALGHYYYHGHLDYDHALEQFDIALESQPNNGDLLNFIGFVQRRQGKMEQALIHIKKASDLDPLAPERAFELADTYMLLRKYPEAEYYYKRTALSPDLPWPYANAGWLYLLWQGDIKKARATIEQVSWKSGYQEHPYDLLKSVLLDVLEKKYQEALENLSSIKLESFDSQFYFVTKAQLYARINGLNGNQQEEQAYYETARSILEAKIQEQPEDSRFHSSLGIAYAGLGRKADAIREGELATDLLPVTKDAWRGAYRVEDLARIYVMVGEFDAAIDQIEYLLSIPTELSIPLLRLDPDWKPLYKHLRFQKLLDSDN